MCFFLFQKSTNVTLVHVRTTRIVQIYSMTLTAAVYQVTLEKRATQVSFPVFVASKWPYVAIQYV